MNVQPIGERVYPLPRPENTEPSLPFGLVVTVAHDLTVHGFPRVGSSDELRELEQALVRFLYHDGGYSRDVDGVPVMPVPEGVDGYAPTGRA
jgi:hypothetical protein